MTAAPGMTGSEWLERFAAALGTEAPTPEVVEQLLDLAGAAAHGSERIAAPIACYLVGATGMNPEQALALARTIAG